MGSSDQVNPSLSIESLAALSQCSNLRSLDLSGVSQKMKTADLCRATDTLDHLDTFSPPVAGLLPPSPITDFTICPAHVRRMRIRSNLCFTPDVLSYLRWPSSLSQLCLEHLYESDGSVVNLGNTYRDFWLDFDLFLFLSGIAPQLEYLEVGQGVTELNFCEIHQLLWVLPCIHTLRVHVDHIEPMHFESPENYVYYEDSPLVALDLTVGPEQERPFIWIWYHFIRNEVFTNLQTVELCEISPTMRVADYVLEDWVEGSIPDTWGVWFIENPWGVVEYHIG